MTEPIQVSAFYHFARMDDPRGLQGELRAFCIARGIFGTILLAQEGINGTIAGMPAAVTALLERLRAVPGFAALEAKHSGAHTMPFRRLKVRLKREIVTMGVPDIDPVGGVGTYLEPQAWNSLLADPDVVLIDTRNDFEVQMGTFRGAVNPAISHFGAFPAWLDQQAESLQGKKVAMFCTGGIRCEKATAYARAIGLSDVFHLKGGILKYLEEMPQGSSRWDGQCFVFDDRVGLGHGLDIMPGPPTA